MSLRDNLDLSTPSGRLMMQLLGAMAEFERALIQERVKAGLAHARARGKRLGRPRTYVNSDKILELRKSGLSWRAIAKKLGVGIGTVHRAAHNCSKNDCGTFGTDDQTESEEFRLMPTSAIRQARGWSQRDLGKRLGTDRAHISRFETEPVFRMKPETVFRLAGALDVPPHVLIQIAEARFMKREAV